MSDPAERVPRSADQLPEPAEEHPDRPAPPAAEQDDVMAPGYGISSGVSASIARGVMPPASPTGPTEPDPHTGPETMPSGAEPDDAEHG